MGDNKKQPPPCSENLDPFCTLLAGFVAGAVSRTATAPADRVAMVMRAGSDLHPSNNPLKVMTSMYRHGGLRSLWFGNAMNVYQVGPESALFFFFDRALRPYIYSDPHHPTTMERFLCGGAGGFFSMTAVYPMYVAQARMSIAEAGVFNGPFDFFKKTVAQDGIRALGNGYPVSSIRIWPYKGIDMMGYLTLREYFVLEGCEPTIGQSLAFGFFPAALSQIVTAPLLNIRTKLMAQVPSLGRPILYDGTMDCARKVIFGDQALGLEAQGIRGLYRGLGAYIMKMGPGTAIQFACYDQVAQLFHKIENREPKS